MSKATTLRSRFRTRVEALSHAIQRPETVTRSSTIQVVSTGVEDIDPPDDIITDYELYEEIGLIRANINQFVSDVTEPGVRVTSPSETTEDYFMGGENAPSDVPDDGFLENCYMIDESHQPFRPLFKQAVKNRWARGTFMAERLKTDNGDADSPISGYYPIRPETVSARAYDGTNILLAPDPDDPRNADIDPTLTPREEVAAYVQFDESSILGRRLSGGLDDPDRPLSQNDVVKATLDQNIGGPNQEDGIYGVSIIKAVRDDATEFRNIKRDLETAVKAKAWGVYDAEFETKFIETPDENILIEWDSDEIDDWVSEYGDIGPGDIISHDGSVNLNKFASEVPDLRPILDFYVDTILTPLPAPKFTIGHEGDINRRVTQEQDPRYQQIIQEERRFWERIWSAEFREVARRHPDLTADGLQVEVQPRKDESPILSLDSDTMDRLADFAGALSDIYGPGGAPAFIQERVLNELVLQLPEEANMGGDADEALEALDEADPEVQAQFAALMNGE